MPSQRDPESSGDEEVPLIRSHASSIRSTPSQRSGYGIVRSGADLEEDVILMKTNVYGSFHSRSEGSYDALRTPAGQGCCRGDEGCPACVRRALGVARSPAGRTTLTAAKIGALFVCTVLCSVVFVSMPNKDIYLHQFSVRTFTSASMDLPGVSASTPIINILTRASYLARLPDSTTHNVTFTVHSLTTNVTQKHTLVVVAREDLESFPESNKKFRFEVSPEIGWANLTLTVSSNTLYSVPVAVAVSYLTTAIHDEVIYAAVILIFVYILIIFELVHRALAAMFGALAAVAVLASLNERPSLDEVMRYIDSETLVLLFGMMILVSITCESGIFDWAAMKAFKLTGGKTWPMITLLCLFGGVVSGFLDNVTTILLLTPVTIRLCEVLELDPKHVLMAEVLFSNIGGTMTAVGDPPNVIIVSDVNIQQASNGSINFASFTLHMTGGIVFVLAASYALLRFMYRNKELLKHQEPQEVVELRKEVEIWRRSAAGLGAASREERQVEALLQQKVAALEHEMQEATHHHRNNSNQGKDYEKKLQDMITQYTIRNVPLLVKSCAVMLAVMVMFFVHPFIGINISIGWIALLGAVWLLVLADYKDLDTILHRIEWSTLIFFSALFVMMGCLEDLGLMAWIAARTTDLVMTFPPAARLTLALITVQWVSALASSFIDNIPFTTAMIPVVVQLGQDPDVDLPLAPLVYALAFGACLGGNGTLIGASCNIVCAGLAENHGCGFTFAEFFKVGFPTMIVSNLVATCYLLIVHVAIGWN